MLLRANLLPDTAAALYSVEDWAQKHQVHPERIPAGLYRQFCGTLQLTEAEGEQNS